MMPLWRDFVFGSLLIGLVSLIWLMFDTMADLRRVERKYRAHFGITTKEAQERERKIFEAIARGRR